MAFIWVDGKKIEAKDGSLLIDVLFANNIHIPHFCYHPALGKDGNCRMCMVEIEGKKRPQIACDTPVVDGMNIKTKGENIDRVKKQILELELINHPIDCPICDQAGECSLQDYYMDVGLYDSRLNTSKNRAIKRVDLGSNVVLDQERCVLCTRCVRFTKNITKTNELGVIHRSDRSVISTFDDNPLKNPYAMNVVDLCPVGALTSKDFRFKKRVWFLNSFESICNKCSKGCNIYVDHSKSKYEEDKIYRYRPRYNKFINGYFICDVGRLSYKEENENTKVNTLLRGNLSEYEYANSKFLRLLKRFYSKILFLISPSLSLEEMYRICKLTKKFGANISGFDLCEYDKNFGDDFLRCNDLSTNRRALKILNISQSKEELDKYLSIASLVVFVGREDYDLLKGFGQIENSILVNQAMPSMPDFWDLFLPYKTFASKEGSYINIDGYLQYVDAKVGYANEVSSLNEIIESCLQDGVSTCRDIWKSGLENFFDEISFDDIVKNTPKIEL